MKLTLNVADCSFDGINIQSERGDYNTIELMIRVANGDSIQEHTVVVDVLHNRTSVQSSTKNVPREQESVPEKRIKEVFSETSSDLVSQKPQEKQEEVDNSCFFLSPPLAEGSFSFAKVTPVQTDECVYMFQVSPTDPYRAFFGLDVADGIRLIEQESASILPACEVYSTGTNELKAISTAQMGIAIKQGEQWIVMAKAKVEYK